MNNNQDNQSWGGTREGAGRPKGTKNKPRISDYITLEEVKELVNKAKEQARERPELLKFLLEQVFGKANQNIDLGNSEGEPLKLVVDPAFLAHRLNASTSETITGSPESGEIQNNQGGA